MDAEGVAQVFCNLTTAGAGFGGYGNHQPLAFPGLELGKVYKFSFVLEIVVGEKQLAYENLGEGAYQEHSYKSSFTHGLEGAEEPEGEGNCYCCHGCVAHQLADTELLFGYICHGLGKGLGREHDYVGYYLAAGTEGAEDTSCDYPEEGCRIYIYFYASCQVHADVDGGREDEGGRYLQELMGVETAAEYDDLKQQQEHVE